MPYVPVRDIDIWFDRAGTGTPLLAISGSRGDLRRNRTLTASERLRRIEKLIKPAKKQVSRRRTVRSRSKTRRRASRVS